MRYVFAFTSLALAAVFVIMGIGQVTFLSGPHVISVKATPDTSLHYSVIPAEVLLKKPGQPSLNIEGKGVAFAGYGSTADVEAWLAPFDHEVFAYDAANTALVGSPVAGVAAGTVGQGSVPNTTPATEVEFQNPEGSDLWLDEVVGEGPQTLFVDATEQTSVIIASNGKAAQPAKISVAWVQNQSTPWFGPLMTLGALFAVLGIVLYLLAVDHDKRGTGPRRGNNKPFSGLRTLWNERFGAAQPKKTERENPDAPVVEASGVTKRLSLAFVAVLASSLFLTTGCSAKYWPSFQAVEPAGTPAPTPTETSSAEPAEEAEVVIPPVPVTEPQLERIVTRIAQTAVQADEEASEELIKTRFVGSALQQRIANYKIRAAVPGTLAPLALTGDLLGYELIQSTEGWPRTILATTSSTYPDGQEAPTSAAGKVVDSAALALLLRQESPYSNYMVHNVVEIRGGIVFPEAIAADEGIAVLPNDVKTLVMQPQNVGVQYGQILENGSAAPGYAKFDLTDDALLDQMGQAWVAKAQEEAAAQGETVQYSLAMSQADDVVTLSTGADGALVSVTINEKHIATSTQERGSVKLTPSVKALSGLDGSKKSIYQLWQHQMLFFVPNADTNQKIRVLGSTTAMTGAGAD